MKKIFLAFLFVFLLVPLASADPEDVTFYWTYTNSDFETIDGFNLYMRDLSIGEYPDLPAFTALKIDACPEGPLTCCMVNAIDGIKLFVLTAYRGEEESEMSQEVYYDPAALQTPLNFQIVTCGD